MTTKYAQGTSVPVERSIAELKRICEKYGASNFGFLQSDSAALNTWQSMKFAKKYFPERT